MGSSGGKVAEENGRLLSEEQQLDQSQASRSSSLSAAKMYSLVSVILVLFGLLIATNLSDWRTFLGQVKEEQEIVSPVRLVENSVKPSVVNQEAEFFTLERESLQEDLKNDEFKEKLREEEAKEIEKAETKKGKKKGKKKKKKKPEAWQNEEYRKSMEAKVDLSAKVSTEQKSIIEKRSEERKRDYLEKQQKMRAAFDRKWNMHLKNMLPREDFELSPEKEKVVDAFSGSLKPPKYCYTSPKGKKVLPREEDKEDRKIADLPPHLAKKILRLASADYPCLVLHQECLKDQTDKEIRKDYMRYDKLYFKRSKLTQEEKISKTPSFASLKLGSCAIVGNADNVIKAKYGKQIDEHDFVVRFNVPIKQYKEAVGTKITALFDKINYKGDAKPTMFNLFPKYVPFELDPKGLPGGKQPLLYGLRDRNAWRKDLEQMVWAYMEEKNLTTAMETFGVPKLQHPTGGITRLRALVQFLSSGLCDRLDVYGFSIGGGKYFERGHIVSRAHQMASENYIYRLWMATGVHGKFCLYGR